MDDLTICLKLHNGIVQSLHLLKCNHEEADDRIMYHVNHAVAIDNFTRMIVASADTDVPVCLMYHFSRWKQFNLKELWVLGGQGTTRRAVPVHNLVAAMDPRVVNVLPAVHSLSGCDTTSKVSRKKSTLKVASLRSDLLEGFGQGLLSENMISSAEKFMVGCISDLDKVETFDELRHCQYHKKIIRVQSGKASCYIKEYTFTPKEGILSMLSLVACGIHRKCYPRSIRLWIYCR